MVAGVFAELSKDEREIILAVTGEDFELDRAAKGGKHQGLALRTVTCCGCRAPGRR